jgi:RNA polymerase sigma-70 factor (ECF subfamily)
VSKPPNVTDLENEFARHHDAAFGWALACCRWDRSAAEDVLQTAYLKLIDGRASFAGRSDFRTFLFGVIKQTARDERRRRAIRAFLPLGAVSGPRETAPGPDAAAALIRDEESRRLVQALTRLPSRQREVLHLVFYQDLTIAQAAEVIGVALGTARVHYERGKARLRALLGGAMP